ncbi:MAG: AAA family ATPase, partial [Candidatus Hadarchaeales archaeon]
KGRPEGERGSPKVETLPYISGVELRGFKSFGNAKVVIPLSKGLTAITGKNGSGKSNIVDALSFVFGEKSKKIMRATQLTDFIYKKNKKRFLAPFAEVSLTIDNSDNSIPVNSPIVKITRRVEKSGKCIYKINDERAELQTIVDLLAPIMGGPESFSFVFQGQVGKIVEMDPEERRGIIERLAGISDYDSKKKAAESELSAVDRNLDALRARVGEMQKTIESLRSQVQAMLKYKQVEMELQQVRGAILQKEVEVLLKKKTSLEKSMKHEKRKMAKLEKRKKIYEKRVKTYEEKIAKIQEKIKKIEESKVMEKVANLRTRISALEGMIKQYERERSRIQAKLDAMSEASPETQPSSPLQRFEEVKRAAVQLIEKIENSTTLEEAKSSVAQLKAVLGELEEIFRSVVSAFSEGKSPIPEIANFSERSRLVAELTSYDMMLSKCREEVDSAKRRLEKLLPQEAGLSSRIQKLKETEGLLASKAERWRTLASNISNKLIGLSGEIGRKSGELTSCDEKLGGKMEELGKISVNFEEMSRQTLDRLLEREKSLSEEISALGNVNFRAQEDLAQKEAELASERQKEEKLTAERERILAYMKEIDEKKKEVFMQTFLPIAKNFSELFAELTDGRSGRLLLENEQSPFEGGVIIEADFGESQQLSGGEKTIAGLAFLFAIQKYRPTTFYVLDEIDAHLDASNRRKVAALLRKLSKDSQIVVVTLHHSLAAVADRVFGVTKENGVSKVYSIDLSKMGD